MSVGLNMGYATASTDTGHDSSVFPLATFALDDPQNERDYAYRAVHETVRTAKKLIMTHYGKGSDYNYWVGCSTGGRQGLMEAQRFPKDFDGLIIGAPVLDFTGTQIGGLWNAHAQLGSGQIFPGQLSELAAAEYGSCDGVDGVVDGVIRDPRDCSFDPLTDTNLTSFSDPQREALKHIYEGPKTSDGEPIFPGYLMGISAGGWIPWFSIPGSQSLLEIFGETFMQYMAFKHDPGAGYDWKTEFDFDSDPFEMEFMRKILDATKPDM